MKIRTTLRMTNQEKFIHYYEENLSEADKRIESYKLAVKTWKERHDCDPPYTTFNSFKVSYSVFKRKS
jgi:hypothetical protein